MTDEKQSIFATPPVKQETNFSLAFSVLKLELIDKTASLP